MRRASLAAIILGSVLMGITLGWFAGRVRIEWTTTCRLSPDETWRASLVELGPEPKLDRNVSIRLERVKTHEVTTLLRASPDEGRQIGTERLLWSCDGTKLLLVGRHFYVRDDLMLAGGDQAYFLHDLTSGRSWINSETADSFPPLTADQLAGIEFTEPVILRPRAKVDPDSLEKRE